MLRHLIAAAGNAQLMTPAVIIALAERAGGNYRTLTGMVSVTRGRCVGYAGTLEMSDVEAQ